MTTLEHLFKHSGMEAVHDLDGWNYKDGYFTVGPYDTREQMLDGWLEDMFGKLKTTIQRLIRDHDRLLEET